MDVIDTVRRRAIEKVKKDLGPELMAALNDPNTLEIMLNPDGQLWREEFGSPMYSMGKLPFSRSKTILETIAGYPDNIIDMTTQFLE